MMYKLINVDEHTWAYETMMDDGDRVRFFVLDGADACLVIDSGFFPVDVKSMVKGLLKENGLDLTQEGAEKPVMLANTHADMDHTGGNGSFEAFYMTQTDYDVCRVGERFPDARLIPAEEGTTIELGGRTLRYIMAPGHTAGNTILLDVTNRVLYPGDVIQTSNVFLFGEHRRPELYAQSLQIIRTMKDQDQFDQIYSCHGQLKMPPEAVDQAIAAWDQVRNGKLAPLERIELFGHAVDHYKTEFCGFFCEPGR